MVPEPLLTQLGKRDILDVAEEGRRRAFDEPVEDRPAKMAGVVQRMRKSSVPSPVLSPEQKDELKQLRASGRSPELGMRHAETKYGARNLAWKQSQIVSPLFLRTLTEIGS